MLLTVPQFTLRAYLHKILLYKLVFSLPTHFAFFIDFLSINYYQTY